MRKVNTNQVTEETWSSPKGRYVMAGRGISEALGRRRDSLDVSERHPFDVEIQRIPPGSIATVFHSHSAQWEFYHVISGSGSVRHDGGVEPIVTGDAFLFKPGEAHQVRNTGEEDLHYPDSGKWAVRSPEHRLIRSGRLLGRRRIAREPPARP